MEGFRARQLRVFGACFRRQTSKEQQLCQNKNITSFLKFHHQIHRLQSGGRFSATSPIAGRVLAENATSRAQLARPVRNVRRTQISRPTLRRPIHVAQL